MKVFIDAKINHFVSFPTTQVDPSQNKPFAPIGTVSFGHFVWEIYLKNAKIEKKMFNRISQKAQISGPRKKNNLQ